MHRSRSALALLTFAVALASTAVASAQSRDEAGEQGMLDAINARRAAAGLAPLERDARLDAAALVHSAEMADRDVLEHVSEQSGTPADRVHAAGLPIDELAENVAMHHSTGDAQRSLEASEPHVANMLNPRFTHVGLATMRDERGIYVTQVFGRLEEAPAEPPAVAEAPPAVVAPPVEAAPGEAVVEVLPEAAPEAPQVVQAPEIAATQAAPGFVAQVAPGSRPTVIVPGQTGRPVAGYWVCSQSRWWYYPMPAGAQPGQQLQPDLSVTGAPAGYAPTGCTAGQMVQPAAPQAYAPPQAYVPPPRVYQPPPVYTPPPPPRVYYPPPPPPRVYYPPPRRRRVVVMPPPGTVIAPYAPTYRSGGGVYFQAPGVRVEGHWGRRRR